MARSTDAASNGSGRGEPEAKADCEDRTERTERKIRIGNSKGFQAVACIV